MFIETDIIEFINRIINSPKGQAQDIKRNLILFRDYLVLTEMTDKETVDQVDKILDCLDGLLKIKKSLGVVDIAAIINAPNTEKGKALKKIPITQNQYADKHYNHYESDSSSSSCYSCGARSTTTSRRRC